MAVAASSSSLARRAVASGDATSGLESGVFATEGGGGGGGGGGGRGDVDASSLGLASDDGDFASNLTRDEAPTSARSRRSSASFAFALLRQYSSPAPSSSPAGGGPPSASTAIPWSARERNESNNASPPESSRV
jgi:hypothetical protein